MGFDGIRESLNKHPSVLIGASLAVVGMVIFASVRAGNAPRVDTSNLNYFTADDGKTFFKASFSSPPFTDPTGRPAVIAQVFTSDGGATKFVGYLMRSRPHSPGNGNPAPPMMPGDAMEVKKCGPGHAWIVVPAVSVPLNSREAAAYQDVVRVRGSDGRPALPLVPVE